MSRLSFQQQRLVREKRISALEQLDLAALLRVLDQNWYDLGSVVPLDRETRTWVKELQTVRNKWAHLPAEDLPPSETYRDADTLGRLLAALTPESPLLLAVDNVKDEAMRQMTSAEPGLRPPQMAETAHLTTSTFLFSPGQLVTLRAQPDILVPVLRAIQASTENRYEVFQNGVVATYYESQLQAVPRPTNAPAPLELAEVQGRLTSLKLLSPSVSNLLTLGSGRVNFVPYQYRPVLKLIRADRPRLLVADEVGVGKTVEAGLILKELQARMEINSVLVICPKALVAERKWWTEMKRFDEHFVALDGPALQHCLRETHLDGEWPQTYAKAILPFSLFDEAMLFGKARKGRASQQGLLDLDSPPRFDLVIIDEAHHIRNTDTYLHQGVRYFCDHAQAVLMLTATPVQLGSEDLFTLLNVLRPDLVVDVNSFEQMAEPNLYINEAVQHCRAARPGWEAEARACLDRVGQTEWGRLFLRESPEFQAIYDQLTETDVPEDGRIRLTHDIEGLYTFSPLINRTRRRDIGEFTTRKPETREIPFTPEQQQVHDHLLDVVARILTRVHGDQNVNFMMSTIRRQAASSLYGLVPLLEGMLRGKLDTLEVMEVNDMEVEPEVAFLDRLQTDVEGLLSRVRQLDPRDPKAESLLALLREKTTLPKNKALVFSTFRHTLHYLLEHCKAAGLLAELVHGDVPDEERRELRRRFALSKESPEALDVLLSSEVGCEGLDFQFCDFLVNYDLPWNPMRIEQRIGRIDRYGQQSESVAIVNMITPGTVDADIYDRCLLRIGIFHRAIGGNEEILGEITRDLHSIAESFNLTEAERQARLQQLADNRIRQLQEEQRLEAKQAELFGLSVPHQSWKDDLAAAQSFWLSPEALRNAVDTYLTKRLGIETSPLAGEKPLKNLRLAVAARNTLLEDYLALPKSQEPVYREWEKWLKGVQPNLPVTFEQEVAASQPGTVHLTATHPLVRQAARHLELKEARSVSVRVQRSDLPPGSHPFALYRWEKKGVRLDEALVPIAGDPRITGAVLEVLQSSEESSAAVPTEAQREQLDGSHYTVWAAAQADHREQNRQLVAFKLQSLTTSHRARTRAIEDQLNRATNEKIRLMKESELARANNDFDRRVATLQQAAESGDIRATPVLFGTLEVIAGATA